ncbi:MAG: hypothetical protein KBG48_26375 [Kofleriaceae bacterium]|nr:hypothetical protein [Kofleriaceae bacterium]MBP9170951.1 hypothetical protein [Kofleriaceae bacterium]MBP9863103.1 hypothetical protein [Kofleriaceae bacterium]
MTAKTPRPFVAVLVGLSFLGACGEPRPRGWVRPVGSDAAQALAAKCLPGAAPEERASGELAWSRRDPGPDGFWLEVTFGWHDAKKASLASIRVAAYGPMSQQTPANGRRYRAAIECILGPDVVATGVRAKVLSLVDALVPPGRFNADLDGFWLLVDQSAVGRSFIASAAVFGPAK